MNRTRRVYCNAHFPPGVEELTIGVLKPRECRVCGGPGTRVASERSSGNVWLHGLVDPGFAGELTKAFRLRVEVAKSFPSK